MWDPLSWGLSFFATRGALAAWDRLQDSSRKELEDAARDWSKQLPAELCRDGTVTLAALFDEEACALEEGRSPDGGARVELATSLRSGGLPAASIWHAALLERWRALREELGETGNAFFRADEATVSPHLRELAEALWSATTLDDKRFRSAVLARLEQVPDGGAPEDARRRPLSRALRIALVMNGQMHYAASMREAFLGELKRALPNHRIDPEELAADPSTGALSENVARVQRLLKRFDRQPDYVVAIGTAAAEAACAALSARGDIRRKLVYMGVTAPERSGLVGAAERVQPGGMVAGVKYAVAADENVKMLLEAFAPRKPTFAFAPGQYPQDEYVLDELSPLLSDGKVRVLRLDSPGPVPIDPATHVLFGRLFVCSNMPDLAASNPTLPLIGVSPENLSRGATMAIGFSPVDVGVRCARQLLLPDYRGESQLNGRILDPGIPLVAVSPERLERCGVRLSRGFLAKYRVVEYRA